jgi:hypothetical protein
LSLFCNIGSDANFDVFSVVPLDLKPGSGGSHAVQELGEHAGLCGMAGKFWYLSKKILKFGFAI